MTTHIPFAPLALDQSDVRYVHGPDSTRQDGVPTGTVTKFDWTTSAIFPGTSRSFWVYVPAQYDAGDPPSLLVCQDGEGFMDDDDEVRATVVLDNLIHRGDLPPTIAVFVDPGVFEGVEDPKASRNRNVEYDAFDDRYVRFLVDEILPEVMQRWAVTDDHDRWGICGFSSRGNCALTAAWFRPDMFRRVICWSASFAQMPGGNPYPRVVPQTPAKPLRVFMLAAHRDLGWNEPEWNWLAENLRVAASLAEAAYDVRLVLGDGAHDPNHGGVLFPDALRWSLGAGGGVAGVSGDGCCGCDGP